MGPAVDEVPTAEVMIMIIPLLRTYFTQSIAFFMACRGVQGELPKPETLSGAQSPLPNPIEFSFELETLVSASHKLRQKTIDQVRLIL